MKLTFSELLIAQKALKEVFANTRSEKEAAETGILISKLEGEIVSRERCVSCEREFTETDKKLFNSRPSKICVACFTSNA